MNVSAFYTQTTTPPAALQTGALSTSGAASTSLFGKQGAAGFLDLLLASLTQGQGQQEALTATQKASGTGATTSGVQSDQNDSSLESLLIALSHSLENAKAGGSGNPLLLEDGSFDPDFLAHIQSLLSGSGLSSTDLSAFLASANLQDADGASLSGKNGLIQIGKSEAGENLIAFLSANLTPEQIATLAKRLEDDLKAADGQTPGAAFLAALLAQNQTTSENVSGSKDAASSSTPATPLPNATALTDPGTATESAQSSDALALAQVIAKVTGENRDAAKDRRESRFADLLMQSGADSASSVKTATPSTNGAAHSADGTSVLKTLSSTDALSQKASGGPSSGDSWALFSAANTSLDPDATLAHWLESLTNPMSAQQTSGMTSSGAVLSAPAALSLPNGAHPATQITAAALIRTAQNGETKTLTLNLEPPDLGRVSIKMEMGRDRSIKTVLSVEKPEALNLLQRDSHVLERALQNAGFDAGSDSLHFELAQDGSSFGQGRQESGQGYSSTGAGSTADESGFLQIETRMDWFIDPQTGLQRYDLYA